MLPLIVNEAASRLHQGGMGDGMGDEAWEITCFARKSIVSRLK